MAGGPTTAIRLVCLFEDLAMDLPSGCNGNQPPRHRAIRSATEGQVAGDPRRHVRSDRMRRQRYRVRQHAEREALRITAAGRRSRRHRFRKPAVLGWQERMVAAAVIGGRG
jgi:hypothetical protein